MSISGIYGGRGSPTFQSEGSVPIISLAVTKKTIKRTLPGFSAPHGERGIGSAKKMRKGGKGEIVKRVPLF